jgi:hypothetical protein
LSQHAAADREIGSIIWLDLAIAQDASPHFCKIAGSIRLAKSFPSKRARQSHRVREDTSTDDVIAGSVQLEEK